MNRFGLVSIIVIAAKTFEINGTKVELKPKECLFLKRKMIKLMNVASIIPNLQIPLQILNLKISMTGYSITNKDTSTTK